MKILVTGAAGFIGFFVSKKLIAMGHEVTGIDNLNDYYEVSLKKDRLKNIDSPNFTFSNIDLADSFNLNSIFKAKNFDYVINLAAQAGVRYSLEKPGEYINSNIVGFTNILEACRHNSIKHLIYASSSSVYGLNSSIPFSVKDNVDHPVSLYAATKKANELLAHSYSHLYNLPTTGLRFFTVYGPWGRPDMAYFSFTKAIIEGKPIKVFNQGNMERDFTHIDDIVYGVISLLDLTAKPDKNWHKKPNPASSLAPYKIYNIGNNNPIKLGDFISILENKIGKKAEKIFLDMQPGDMKSTFANVDELEKLIDYRPSTTIEDGIGNFVDWYKNYYLIDL